jgi:hypothetical protein
MEDHITKVPISERPAFMFSGLNNTTNAMMNARQAKTL